MIPEKVKIGGAIFTVSLEDGCIVTEDNQTLLARISYDMHRIRVSRFRNDTQGQESSFIHEVIHGLISEYGLGDHFRDDMEEHFVKIFAHGLYQVIKENHFDFSEESNESHIFPECVPDVCLSQGSSDGETF